jgi:multisubunit Na+/H+ antiporter MnhE subunit
MVAALILMVVVVVVYGILRHETTPALALAGTAFAAVAVIVAAVLMKSRIIAD